MPRLKSICAILLALLWVPLTSHCLLEAVGAVPEFLHCADACSPADPDAAADQDTCTDVESAGYKLEEHGALVAQPVLLAVCTFLTAVDLSLPISVDDGDAPPSPRALEQSVTWQFIHRAALSPRAPSLAS